ncbi:hypothetical protein PFR86_003102 [Escherichia coli]|nr:hypothetical protein [Escherichia coli]
MGSTPTTSSQQPHRFFAGVRSTGRVGASLYRLIMYAGSTPATITPKRAPHQPALKPS